MPVCQMPFIITNGISEEEKTAWHNARLAEVEAGTYKGKEITPDFEPIKGWKPLKKYWGYSGEANPAEIIRGAIYDRSRMGIYPGDYIRETVLGTRYKFIIVKIGNLPYLGSPTALMAADKPCPGRIRGAEYTGDFVGNQATPMQWKNWNYQYTSIRGYCNNFYRQLPASLANCIMEVYTPFTQYNYEDKQWDLSSTKARVFIPSATELCPSDDSFESKIHEKAEPDYFIPWPKTYKNSINDLSKLNGCWLRTMFCDRGLDGQWNYLICKCNHMELVGGERLEVGLPSAHAYILPCFCIG
ncbi:DUF6273 domain-containing protein [Gardnerella sp. Marseille-Q2328]|uniref:DUF6273 domain-containing protein n=1 Tax=Gardnerella sp. Marseille-Q2328 TaxID=2759694 RepID=UPI002024B2FD|nr:DUF6273 domain-containing protein [Gardnerella sp. Marseille-Q2328]